MHTFRIALTIVVFSFTISACSSLGLRQADDRWINFKSWTKITEGRPTVGDPTGYTGDTHFGPESYKDVYVNDVGTEVLTSDGPYVFPVGTVLVKEQFKDRDAWQKQENPYVTVSLKVDDTPKQSNWIWADGYTGKAKESLFCLGCHSHAYADDFVFTTERFLSSE